MELVFNALTSCSIVKPCDSSLHPALTNATDAGGLVGVTEPDGEKRFFGE